MVLTPPADCMVVLTPPADCRVVLTPPADCRVVMTPPADCRVVLTPPDDCRVVLTPRADVRTMTAVFLIGRMLRSVAVLKYHAMAPVSCNNYNHACVLYLLELVVPLLIRSMHICT